MKLKKKRATAARMGVDPSEHDCQAVLKPWASMDTRPAAPTQAKQVQWADLDSTNSDASKQSVEVTSDGTFAVPSSGVDIF